MAANALSAAASTRLRRCLLSETRALPSSRSAFHSSRPTNSAIGKRLITLPPDVTIEVMDLDLVPYTNSRKHVVVKGPKGTLEMPLQPFISFGVAPVEGSEMRRLQVLCEDPAKNKFQRAMWGTTNALVSNMIEGVADGISVIVRLVGVGYRATMIEGALDLKLGYSHQILLPVPDAVSVVVQNPQRLKIMGMDKQTVMKFASLIRSWRPPEP